jgi:hypothetical protein
MADKKESVQLSESAAVKALMAKKGQFASAAKKKRPTGIMNDMEILARLGIGPNESKVYSANVNNIKPYYAKDDANRLAFNFAYTINSDDKEANGITLRSNHILEETDYKTLEQVIEELMFELQGLGEHTDSYKDPIGEAVKAMAKHTKEKTEVRLTVKHYVGKKARKDGTFPEGINLTVNPVLGNEDLPSDDEDTDAGSEEPPTNDEAGVEDGAFNPDEWIGVKIRYSFSGDGDAYPEGDYDLTIKSYDEATESFICEDEGGEEWSGDYAVNVYEGVYEAI